ncbi:hypothetical protein F2Q70_00009105 [Brassica cretica]|uniref:Uncharacterized protein n=1 Tax=Brassica cretica TaxID=69181 RepID=A0A8S9M802_BRACR|nr:hypothetical protein F2Q70_00009105 [Brassica cretica]
MFQTRSVSHPSLDYLNRPISTRKNIGNSRVEFNGSNVTIRDIHDTKEGIVKVISQYYHAIFSALGFDCVATVNKAISPCISAYDDSQLTIEDMRLARRDVQLEGNTSRLEKDGFCIRVQWRKVLHGSIRISLCANWTRRTSRMSWASSWACPRSSLLK